MTVPDWRDPSRGSRVRAALWLHTEVGEGNTFTKNALREAFPSVAQVDRRVRDLRKAGWVIAEYRVDRGLGSSAEMRLVTKGDDIWEEGYRFPEAPAVTAKQRQEIFAADNYLCVLCGIAGGEPYPEDAFTTAKLTLARVPAPGRDEPMLKTVCDRCRAGRGDGGTAEQTLAEIDRLDDGQRQRLQRWVAAGGRQATPEDLAWARYRRLPSEARREIEQYLNPG